MQTIHKYVLGTDFGPHTIYLPVGAKVLSAEVRHNEICIWAIVDTTELQTLPRYFRILPTGDEIFVNLKDYRFLNTVIIEPLVYHIFEEL